MSDRSGVAFGSRNAVPYVAMGLAILAALLLAAMHALNPQLDPATHLISEYAVGPYGWVMRLCFFAWSACCLLLAYLLRTEVAGFGGQAGRWLLALIGIALLGTAYFKTNPIDQLYVGAESRAHAACAMAIIGGTPVAAWLIHRGLRHRPTPNPDG